MLIAIVGDSGSGKSTSVRNLNHKETFIISTTGKRPGIKGAAKKYPFCTKQNPEGNFYQTSFVNEIENMLIAISTKRPEIKTVVIDD